MTNDVVEFLQDIQSIIPKQTTEYVLFCNTAQKAISIQTQLLQDFNIPSVLDKDYYDTHYVIPLKNISAENRLKFISNGWSDDRTQKFVQYLITLFNEDSASKIYNILIAHGYNVTLSPNNMQLTVRCIEQSEHNTEMQELKSELVAFEKSSPKNIDEYFNKILFNGVIENTEYRKIHKQEFSFDAIEQNRDLIIRGIVYQYFNRKIRFYLNWLFFPKTFDANKLKSQTIQNINLIRDFLYYNASQYIDTQINNAIINNTNPIIIFDYLKKHSEYYDVKTVLKLAEKWQCSNIKNDRIKKRNERMSSRHAYKLMDLDDGYYVVYLGAQEAVDYENHTLKHRTEIFYDDDIWEGITRYSIRKDFTPLVTLTINGDEIVKCSGYENSVPCDDALRKAIRTFMQARGYTIPNNSFNKTIGYIRQNGTVYDIFNLPENFVFDETLNLEHMGLEELPYIPTATIQGNLLCHQNNLSDLTGAPNTVSGNCDFSLNPLTSLYGMPRNTGGMILLSGHKLNAESFVPIYLEEKLNTNDVLGVDKNVIESWKEQIKLRKTGIQNIILSLSEHKK